MVQDKQANEAVEETPGARRERKHRERVEAERAAKEKSRSSTSGTSSSDASSSDRKSRKTRDEDISKNRVKRGKGATAASKPGAQAVSSSTSEAPRGSRKKASRADTRGSTAGSGGSNSRRSKAIEKKLAAFEGASIPVASTSASTRESRKAARHGPKKSENQSSSFPVNDECKENDREPIADERRIREAGDKATRAVEERVRREKEEADRLEAERAVAENEEDERKKRLCKIGACSLLFLFLIGGGVGAYFALSDGSSEESGDNTAVANAVIETPAPTTLNTVEVPSESPSTSNPTIAPTELIKYNPPSKSDCDRLALGLPLLEGEEELETRNFDVLVDVNLEEGTSMESLFPTLVENVRRYLVPELAGCPQASKRRRRRSNSNRMLEARKLENIRNVISSADVQVDSEMDATCVDTSSPSCAVVAVNLNLKLLGPEPNFKISVIIDDVFPDGIDIAADLQLTIPFRSVIPRRIRSNDPTEAPSLAPTMVASEVPSAAPTVTVSSKPSAPPSDAPSLAASSAPTAVTPSPTVATPSPTIATPVPTVGATPSPTLATPVPTISPSSAPSTSSLTQQQILVAIQTALGITPPHSTDPSSMRIVETCVSGTVTALTWFGIDYIQLSGFITSEIGLLTALTSISTGGMNNRLGGTIPSEIGLLTDLETIMLASSDHSGPMPSEIGRLTSLTELSLGYNQMTGTIPTEIGNLRALLVASGSSNAFTGPLPSEIGNMGALSTIDFGSCRLSGNIPSEIGNMGSMLYLTLSNNDFTGTIPAEIANLLSLDSLSLMTLVYCFLASQTGGNLLDTNGHAAAACDFLFS